MLSIRNWRLRCLTRGKENVNPLDPDDGSAQFERPLTARGKGSACSPPTGSAKAWIVFVRAIFFCMKRLIMKVPSSSSSFFLVFWFTSVASLVAYRAELKWEAIVEMVAHGDELEHACSARQTSESMVAPRAVRHPVRCCVGDAPQRQQVSPLRRRDKDGPCRLPAGAHYRAHHGTDLRRTRPARRETARDRVCGARTCRHQRATPDQARRARTCPSLR